MHDPIFILANICVASSLILGLFNWQYFDTVYKILVVQLAFALIVQIIGGIYGLNHASNTVIYNSYLFLDLWLMGLLVITLVNTNMHKTLVFVGLLICTIIDVACIWKMGINTFANWGYLSSSILFTIAFLSIFMKLLFNSGKLPLIKQPGFWLCTGILIYYGCNVPLFGFLNYLIKYHPGIASKTYSINDLLDIVRYSFIGVAFVLQRRFQKQSKVSQA